MSYIIMARGEDGMEFRPEQLSSYPTREDAEADVEVIEANYPESHIWVEVLRDKDHYMKKHQAMLDNDEQDLY